MAFSHYSSFPLPPFPLPPRIEPPKIRCKIHQKPFFFLKIEADHLRFRSHQNPARTNLEFSCFAEKSSIKRKTPRSTKSNEELCNELREFISMIGLPEDLVPSTKVLTDHGRKDLANIVRRRGYKVVMELLKNSFQKDTDMAECSLQNQDTDNFYKDEIPEDRESDLNKHAEPLLPNTSSLMEICSVKANGSIPTHGVQDCQISDSSFHPLHVEETNFVRTGLLDSFEEALNDETVTMDSDTEIDSDFSNSRASASVASHHVHPCSREQQPDREDAASCEELNDGKFDVGECDNQIEIEHLKTMLGKKEMELSLLKQQIGKEKRALLSLQATVSSEINIIESEKEVELDAFGENIFGLKEVHIEFWANGEIVEISGNFNGWQQRIRMDPHSSSSNTINPHGSRKSKLWSTILWLYPGRYEIKFIVDGHWQIDSQREVISSGSIANNVLIV